MHDWKDDCHTVGRQKLLHFGNGVSESVVVMKESVAVAPQLRSFATNILSQPLQNVTVKLSIDRLIRKDEFPVHNPLM